ncbi:serine/threonine-protein kinase [Kitasatospora aureofaciens]|uniref:serine/threonine-protein kinase n=1 Tax=Kitasatospora aureofaciens TaxID=1894 RepID=UPI001C48E3D1|nr:serine/threonine-protein kinase [Kitasatospora aureofaciens]MBV6697340.1 serine/threonine-protein kinase [Kitasatospora aureofaciens]
MGEFTPEAADALKAAEAVCGPVELEEISDRRGSAVWKATGPRAAVSIKVGTGDAAEVTAREAAVLDQLPGYTVTAGRFGDGVWYVTPWLAGPSTWKVFQPLRKGEADRSRALAAAVDLCRAVGCLHADGWVHGDIQPQHGVHTEHGVRLLDFAWSRRIGTTPWTAFDGTMIHLTSPELAARISTGPQPVNTTQPGDVYALAGTLWACTTGNWPLDYAAAGLDRAAGPAALRDAIASRTVPLSAETPWPELQAVLRRVLLSEPADRPIAEELADLVAAVSV